MTRPSTEWRPASVVVAGVPVAILVRQMADRERSRFALGMRTLGRRLTTAARAATVARVASGDSRAARHAHRLRTRADAEWFQFARWAVRRFVSVPDDATGFAGLAGDALFAQLREAQLALVDAYGWGEFTTDLPSGAASPLAGIAIDFEGRDVENPPGRLVAASETFLVELMAVNRMALGETGDVRLL